MAVIKLVTPPMKTTGLFKVKEPFTVVPDQKYTVIAIRRYRDLLEAGTSVYSKIYEPLELTEENYTADYEAGASLITLYNETLGSVYVPDTWILEYPTLNSVPYSQRGILLLLGALPETLDLSFAVEQAVGIVTDSVGKTCEGKLVAFQTTNAVSPEDHLVAEESRLASIRLRTTDRERLVEMTKQRDRLVEQNETLRQILEDNGLLD